MTLRALSLATVLVLAATGLTACTSKVGQAAVVGDHRISQKDVTRYVDPKGPSAAAVAQEQGTPTSPKVFILDTLIQQELFRVVLKASPAGIPSDAKLRSYHDLAAEKIIGAPVGGAAFDTQYTKQFTGLGYRASIEPVVVQTAELEYALVLQTKAASLTDLVKAITATHTSVSVSGRFGKWSPTNLSLSDANGAGLPSFVTFGSDTQAVPTATPSQ